MTYYQIFDLANNIFYILLGISALLLFNKVIYHIYAFMPSKKMPVTDKQHKFAIIIPARNESKVIKGLFDSIQAQKYDLSLLDTYVVVESEQDPTCEIAKNYPNTSVFVRQKLHLKGKGHALNEVMQDILATDKQYDAFMIFDADNVLYNNFFEEMNKSYAQGQEICLGRRDSKNWNDGWISTSSALIFSVINSFQNKYKTDHGQNVVISGAGFYVSSELVKKWGGWPFHTLTEDYEISLYATANNIRTYYNPKALFYDEQVTGWRASWKQRIRWVKGYNQANKIYNKQLYKGVFKDKGMRLSKFWMAFGVAPLIFLYASIIVYLLFTLALGLYGIKMGYPLVSMVFSGFGYTILAVYLFFVFYGMLAFLAESKHCTVRFSNYMKTLAMYPFFMVSYLVVYVAAMFKKKVEWVPTEHKVNIDIETGQKIA